MSELNQNQIFKLGIIRGRLDNLKKFVLSAPASDEIEIIRKDLDELCGELFYQDKKEPAGGGLV